VLALLPIIDGIEIADKSRIGMFGWSRGGMMTYLALRNTNRIKAVVVGGAPTDLIFQLSKRPMMEKYVFKRMMPNYKNNKTKLLKDRSAIYWPEMLHKDTPILILHGEKDKRVTMDDALNLSRKLTDIKHPHKLVLYPNGTHSLKENKEDVQNEIKLWFNKYL
jgi:dipeptidyl aminopeptidase/acylaminoacyl peptidase